MKNIITIAGSNSKKSINKQLVEYAGSLVKGVALTKIDLNDFEMPLFSVDVESAQGFSQNAKDLNAIFDKADGFVISLAEHNGAYSTAFKNTFDWLSRQEGKVWRNKPVLLLSTSPGARGGQSVLELAKNSFPHMGGNVIGAMPVPSFYDNFKNGTLTETGLQSNLLDIIGLFEKAI